MSEKQKTIQKEVSLKGFGLHTGREVTVSFKPAAANSGIRFVRVDLSDRPVIKADFSNILENAIPRCTSVGSNGASIHTVEHLMSVLCGLAIDNLIVEINGEEVPGLDGCGQTYLKVLKQAGVIEQDVAREHFSVREPLWVEKNGSSVFVLPYDKFQISYLLDYSHCGIRPQYVSFQVTPETFENEIAPSRTFCLEGEAEELKRRGLGKGANYQNTLVIGKDGVKNNKARFEDEMARHKILDFIGDIYLLGKPLKAHIIAVKSGHTLNFALLRKIIQQGEKYREAFSPKQITVDATKTIDIKGIMSVLPHRYPFLLVDRVTTLEPGKRAVGIKNVTVNDDFFRGHFPTRPIMPGVLMVEAMAQLSGIALLMDKENGSRLALFMAADNVKFRKVVVPGDQLVMETEITRVRTKTAAAQAVAKVNGEVVAEADLMFSFMEDGFLL